MPLPLPFIKPKPRQCRVSGNAFEYVICSVLEKRNCVPRDKYTQTRLLKLREDYITRKHKVKAKDDIEKKKVDQLNIAFDGLGINGGHYYIHHDREGVKGVTADIVVECCQDQKQESDGMPKSMSMPMQAQTQVPMQAQSQSQAQVRCYKLSAKHNNRSAKHQRPNKLHLQLNLSHEETKRFQAAYKIINDCYYMKWTGLGFKRFSQVSQEDKSSLYHDIHELTSEFITKPVYLRTYVSFIADLDPDKVILRWIPKKSMLEVEENCTMPEIGPSTRIRTETSPVFESIMYVYLDDKQTPFMKARLHNASTRITPTLSIKYDTVLA